MMRRATYLFLSLLVLSFSSSVTQSSQAAPPDVNDDGIVNLIDATLASNCQGRNPAMIDACGPADVDGDGDIDRDDLKLVATSLGEVIREPAATVLPTRVFERQAGPPRSETVTFDVAVEGEATLWIVNGSELGGRASNRVTAGEVFLNGYDVVDESLFKRGTNTIKIPVFLEEGKNEVVVRLRSTPGSRIALSIDAPVDSIELEPIVNPLVQGIDELQTRATVTALGIPAADVAVVFAVGGVADQSAEVLTDDQGQASVSFGPFDTVGQGELTARVIDLPKVSDQVGFTVVKAATVKIEQGQSFVAVQETESGFQTLGVIFTPGGGGAASYTIQLSNTIEAIGGADPDGIEVVTDRDTWTSATPATFVATATITGKKAGQYRVVWTATATNSSQYSAILNVFVLQEGVTEPIIIAAPTIYPSALTLGTGETAVAFSTSVLGSATPPEVLTLEEVNDEGDVVAVIGELHNRGVDGTLVNGSYQNVFEINAGDVEGQRRFRLTGTHQGQVFRSGTDALTLTPFPVGTVDVGNPVVVDVETGMEFVGNEVSVKFKPGLTAAFITDLLNNDPRLSGFGAEVLAFVASAGVHQILINGRDDPERVIDALAAFRSLGPQLVDFVEQRGFYYLGGVVAPDRGCDSASDVDCQWGFDHVKADKAWLFSRGTEKGSPVKVAVIDSGLDTSVADIATTRTEYGSDCNGTGDESIYKHGTNVAAVIAASHNNSGISGIAPDTHIVVFKAAPSGNVDWLNLADCIADAAAKADIINMSLWDQLDPELCLRNGTDTSHCSNGKTVEQALLDHKRDNLFVLIAGNGDSSAYSYPGAFSRSNDSIITVGAIQHNGSRGTGWGGTQNGSGYNGEGESEWVNIFAPGQHVPAVDGTTYLNGTSFAAPHVAAAAALLRASGVPINEIKTRLINSAAAPNSDAQNVNRVLDIFAAIANPSFKVYTTLGKLETVPKTPVPGWIVDKNCGVASDMLAPIAAPDGERYAFCQTGPGEVSGEQTQEFSELALSLDIPSGVSRLGVVFSWDFVTDEYIEWLGPDQPFDDQVDLHVLGTYVIETVDKKNDQETPENIASKLVESFNKAGLDPACLPYMPENAPFQPSVPYYTTAFTWVPGLIVQGDRVGPGPLYPCGEDLTVGRLGWQVFNQCITVTPGANQIRIRVTDLYDRIWDSYVLIDNLRFEECAGGDG